MNALITGATLLDKSSPHHGKSVSIRIHKGIIEKIASDLQPNNEEQHITHKDLYISSGWFDSSVSVGEPGFEERETITNALRVAALSGFTTIAVNPNSDPVTDNQAGINFLKNKALGSAVNVLPIGSLTRNAAGIDLAELYDMQQAGAVAFGDYQSPIKNPNLLKLALQYTQGFNGLVLSFPQEQKLVGKGIVNEGVVSTHLGLKGIPALAESLHVARDLYILEYTGGKLHIPTISTAASVKLIREAKQKGLDVTCSVAVAHLLFTDDELQEFDTNFKVLPPLRTKDHQEALIEGLKDGTIDMVCSDHNPLDIEQKKIEFDHAMYGTIAQEAMLGVLLNIVSEKQAIKILTSGRERFNDTASTIQEGQTANLTLFTTKGSRTFTKEMILSKSKNSAFLGSKLKGKVYGIIANNQYITS